MKSRPDVRKTIPLVYPGTAALREGAPYTHLEVSLFYSEGGVNWVSGERNPKGYVLSLRGIEVKPEGGFSFMMFTGWNRAFVVQPATRFNRSTLAKLAGSLDFVWLARLFEEDNLDAIRETLAPFKAAA